MRTWPALIATAVVSTVALATALAGSASASMSASATPSTTVVINELAPSGPNGSEDEFLDYAEDRVMSGGR